MEPLLDHFSIIALLCLVFKFWLKYLPISLWLLFWSWINKTNLIPVNISNISIKFLACFYLVKNLLSCLIVSLFYIKKDLTLYLYTFFWQVVIRNRVKPVTRSINKSKKLSFISPGLSAPINKSQTTTPVSIIHFIIDASSNTEKLFKLFNSVTSFNFFYGTEWLGRWALSKKGPELDFSVSPSLVKIILNSHQFKLIQRPNNNS